MLVGDSQFEVSGPGIIAALEATGEAVATNKGYGGWGTSTVPNWRIGVREAVTETFEQHGWTAPDFLDAEPSDHARRLA